MPSTLQCPFCGSIVPEPNPSELEADTFEVYACSERCAVSILMASHTLQEQMHARAARVVPLT